MTVETYRGQDLGLGLSLDCDHIEKPGLLSKNPMPKKPKMIMSFELHPFRLVSLKLSESFRNIIYWLFREGINCSNFVTIYRPNPT